MTRDDERATVAREVAEETLREASAFPSYEVPAFVLERFPAFDPTNPESWPEPDRCTDGRPYGHNSHGSVPLPRDLPDRWQRYLRALDLPASSRSRWNSPGCRNRWRDPESRLCGTHVKPWRDSIESARKRLARNARELEYRDLAKRLAAHGIEGDAGPNGVLLRRDAIEGLLRLLDARSSDRWPEQGPVPEPPL